MRLSAIGLAVGLSVVLLWAAPVDAQTSNTPTRAEPSESPETKEAPYVPTPNHVVRRMLEAADVGQGDVVYDLGSGDGRIVIMAAREFGARGVGVEIDPELVELSRRKAARAGVSDRVEFRQEDLFETDIREATVVTLYLWPTMNNRLRPKLREELSPDTRILSYSFGIGGWTPDTTFTIGNQTLQHDENTVYVWDHIPDR